MIEETKYCETPNGGVKLTCFYYDEEGNPADKSVATEAVILEYDKDDHVLSVTRGVTKNKK